MAKLYGDVFKDDGDDGREKIRKARETVEKKARERLEKGLEDTIQQAKVAIYKNNPGLVDELLGAPPPEPDEREPESSPARREVESEVMERAAILVDKTPGLTMAQAAIRVLQRDEQLAEKYLTN